MQYFPPALEQLVEQFAKLPGVGVKAAQRLAFHLLAQPEEEAAQFAQAILAAKRSIHCCPLCQNLTEGDGPCPICASSRRDSSLICVVADPKDVAALERSREYNGLYHVLHGAISPALGIGPADIKLKELMKRLQGEVEEVIVATNSSLEGETTAMYLSKLIKPTGIKVTRIASGVPVGGDLEYIDEVTLLRALEGRTQL